MFHTVRRVEDALCTSIPDRNISRRRFLVLTVVGLLAGCSSSPSTQSSSVLSTATASPTQVVLAPLAPISLANVHQITRLAVLNPNNSRVRGLAWSPDGKTLAVGAYAALQLWDATSGKQVASLAGHRGQVFQLAWSPDGQLLASGSDDNTLRIWDVQSHAALHVLQGISSTILSMAWSPDGQRLAAGCGDGTVQIWQRSAWTRSAQWNGPSAQGQFHTGSYRDGVYGVIWSPDGKRLLGTRYDGYIRVWDVNSGKLSRVLLPSSQPNGLSWSPEGHIFASSSDDGTVQFWDSVTYKNTRTLQAETQAGWAYAIPWSPDGHLIATSRDSGIVQVYDTQSGKELTVLQGHTASVWTTVWSPDGLRIASGSDDGTVCLWGVH